MLQVLKESIEIGQQLQGKHLDFVVLLPPLRDVHYCKVIAIGELLLGQVHNHMFSIQLLEFHPKNFLVSTL